MVELGRKYEGFYHGVPLSCMEKNRSTHYLWVLQFLLITAHFSFRLCRVRVVQVFFFLHFSVRQRVLAFWRGARLWLA